MSKRMSSKQLENMIKRPSAADSAKNNYDEDSLSITTTTSLTQLGLPSKHGSNSMYADRLIYYIAKIIQQKALEAVNRTNAYENDVNSYRVFKLAQQMASDATTTCALIHKNGVFV
jgi:hypothetical protein